MLVLRLYHYFMSPLTTVKPALEIHFLHNHGSKEYERNGRQVERMEVRRLFCWDFGFSATGEIQKRHLNRLRF
jgi:hypothetical protein